MSTDARLRRVSNENELHNQIDDYQIQGFSVTERSDSHARLRNNSYGSGGMHFVWFLLTFWFTAGLGNAAYAIYAYFQNSQEVLIKVQDD
jgi:hypothetical protein